MATGLVQAAWVLDAIRTRHPAEHLFFDWDAFTAAGRGILVWEAFVTGTAKGKTDVEDAEIARGAPALGEPLVVGDEDHREDEVLAQGRRSHAGGVEQRRHLVEAQPGDGRLDTVDAASQARRLAYWDDVLAHAKQSYHPGEEGSTPQAAWIR